VVSIPGYDSYEINFENQPFQFTTYEKGEYYNWHQDALNRGAGSDRYCSVVIQLNDEYVGGNLEMKKLDDENTIIQFMLKNLAYSRWLTQP